MDPGCVSDTVSSNNASSNETNMAVALHTLSYYIESHVETTVFFTGMVSNVMSFIVLLNMTMNDVMKILLVTVTVTDFCASLFGFLNMLLESVRFKGDIPYGTYSTGIMEVFVTYKIFLMFLGMSSSIMVIASSVRAYVLIKPLQSRLVITKTFIIKAISLTLTIGFIVFLPNFIYAVWKGCFCDVEHPVCKEFFRILPHADKARIYFSLCVIIIGPGTIIANMVCFSILKYAIKQSKKELQMISNHANIELRSGTSSPTGSRKNMRINRTILLVLLFNSVCLFPSLVQVISLMINPKTLLFDKTNLSVLIVDIIAETFLGFLPCYNFWTYMIHNKDFRVRFLQIFCRQKLHYVTPNHTPNNQTPIRTPNKTPTATPRHSHPVIEPLIKHTEKQQISE